MPRIVLQVWEVSFWGIVFKGAPYRFAVVLTYLYSLNNPPYYRTITVILTPAHIGIMENKMETTILGLGLRV